MIEESGLVVAVRGDEADVVTERRSVCGHCAAQGACGTSLLDRFLGRRPSHVVARNQAGANVGERVVLGIAEQDLLGLSVAAYLVPIGGLLAGMLLGDWWGGGSGIAALAGAALGMALALIWLRRYSVGLLRDGARQPVVLRRIGASGVMVPLSVADPEAGGA